MLKSEFTPKDYKILAALCDNEIAALTEDIQDGEDVADVREEIESVREKIVRHETELLILCG